MTLAELVRTIPEFDSWNHPKKILFFGWFLHTYAAKERLQQSDFRSCYESLAVEKPSAFGPFLSSLGNSKPKRLLEDGKGFFLPKHIREDHDVAYGTRPVTVAVHKLLADLPGKVSNNAERIFLQEALTCFRHSAFRAAIVMTWNLAFYHLREFVFTRRLADFNTQFPKVYPKKRLSAGVLVVEDFNEFKESEFLEVCRGANIIDGNVYKILDEKLGKRNIAAHPSTVAITQLQAEEFISDLANNVILRIAL